MAFAGGMWIKAINFVSRNVLMGKSKKKLLFSVTKKDLKVEFFSGTGAGGQHRNKHQNCVRIHHKDSGATVTGQSNRNRQSNIREAMQNLVKHPKFKIWHCGQVAGALGGKTIEQIVEKQMRPMNLRVETKNENGQWKTISA